MRCENVDLRLFHNSESNLFTLGFTLAAQMDPVPPAPLKSATVHAVQAQKMECSCHRLHHYFKGFIFDNSHLWWLLAAINL